MKISFSKYQGTGNDFIIIDNRFSDWKPSSAEVSMLCDRHFGIGADGLMLLSEKQGLDFAMTYYNSDGRESTMCGNGGRCMVAFARSLGLIEREARFWSVDGLHEGKVIDDTSETVVNLKMKDTCIGKIYDDGLFIDTGSPHFIQVVRDVAATDVFTTGSKLRYDARFSPEGVNVNFTEIQQDGLFVRTFERGVENETLSCGTGVTAAALAIAFRDPVNPGFYIVKTRGGTLKVNFVQHGDRFTEIWLEGATNFVFAGEVTI